MTPLTTIGAVSIDFAHLGLEHPGRPQLADVVAVDLPVRVVAGLLVVAVGVQEVVAVARGAVEEILGDRPHVAEQRGGLDLCGLATRIDLGTRLGLLGPTVCRSEGHEQRRRAQRGHGVEPRLCHLASRRRASLASPLESPARAAAGSVGDAPGAVKACHRFSRGKPEESRRARIPRLAGRAGALRRRRGSSTPAADQRSGGGAMPGKKILMLVGEFSEEYEIFVFEQAMHAVGHTVHVVCPDKKAGENIKTSLHDFEGHQTYTEKLGHLYTLNKTFSEVDPGDYDAVYCRRRPRAGIHPHRPAGAADRPPLPRGRQADLHHLPRRAGADRGRGRGHAASASPHSSTASPRSGWPAASTSTSSRPAPVSTASWSPPRAGPASPPSCASA